MLERAAKTSSDGYPPYNIEQTSPTGLRITLAVAGFTMDDLQITQEDNQLVIRGRQTDDAQGRVFLHRGIAARQFQRAFVLAEGIEVKGAWLDNGLLHIDLARPQPEQRVKTIAINRPECGRREQDERQRSHQGGRERSGTGLTVRRKRRKDHDERELQKRSRRHHQAGGAR